MHMHIHIHLHIHTHMHMHMHMHSKTSLHAQTCLFAHDGLYAHVYIYHVREIHTLCANLVDKKYTDLCVSICMHIRMCTDAHAYKYSRGRVVAITSRILIGF